MLSFLGQSLSTLRDDWQVKDVSGSNQCLLLCSKSREHIYRAIFFFLRKKAYEGAVTPVQRAQKTTSAWQDFSSRVTRYVKLMTGSLSRTFCLRGSFNAKCLPVWIHIIQYIQIQRARDMTVEINCRDRNYYTWTYKLHFILLFYHWGNCQLAYSSLNVWAWHHSNLSGYLLYYLSKYT